MTFRLINATDNLPLTLINSIFRNKPLIIPFAVKNFYFQTEIFFLEIPQIIF